METRDDVKIQVGHCYLVSILEPFKEINKRNPLKVLFLSHGWSTTNAMSIMKKSEEQESALGGGDEVQ